MHYIRDLATITQQDLPLVGGKTAALGQMLYRLTDQGIRVPGGFAITVDGYARLISHNKLTQVLASCIAQIDYTDPASVQNAAIALQQAITTATLPPDLEAELVVAYHELSARYGERETMVAVRSSATAEDLPNASFAGQQETYLGVVGIDALKIAVLRCCASLFTERALVYRYEQGFVDVPVALSVCVQKLVRADQAVSGVLFTIDPDTGWREAVTISATYGLGEALVQGLVTPDEYVVFKHPHPETGVYPITQKRLGEKVVASRIIAGAVMVVPVEKPDQQRFAISDEMIQKIVEAALIIEAHYQRPMDIEWAIDGSDHTLYILQARPETVHSQREAGMRQYTLTAPGGAVLLRGQAIGQAIVHGVVRVICEKADISDIAPGTIVVTTMTDPDWVPLLKRAAALVTDIGGRTCHAAIVSRELGIPALLGTGNATALLRNGQMITLDLSGGNVGVVYEGAVPFIQETVALSQKTIETPYALMVNIADPERAYAASQLPVQGVGLARLEFIMNHTIGIHPMAAAVPDRVTDSVARDAISARASGYETPADYFVERLAQGIATIAATFFPRRVIVRLSDFKSNEYRTLLGGADFEPQEENPMIGWRGAARYVSPEYQPAFALECAALRRVYYEMGFTNITYMVPFVRTVSEAEGVIAALAREGIVRGVGGLQLYMMVEIPSNVLLLEQFAPCFDGFSIGSNDLTQLTLGVDRDSGIMHTSFDERDPAVTALLRLAISKAQALSKPIGICGQAPSDYPEIALLLEKAGITSMSLTPDAIMRFIQNYAARGNDHIVDTAH